MAQALQVELTSAQQQELEHLRAHAAKAYVRVKAAAILKVAAGQAARQVAQHGLLKPVQPETVSAWITRYLQDGAAGLRVQVGRGRKPAFSPCTREHRNRRSRGARRLVSQSAALRHRP
jgi:transposase